MNVIKHIKERKAKVNEIYVSRGSTISMGKYEFERIDLGLMISVDKGDDHDDLIRGLESALSCHLKEWRDTLKA